jgi:hypothetical protein
MNKVAHFQVAAGRIDRKRGTIYGVAVITAGEAKGHGMRVDMTTLEQVMDCAKDYIGGLAVRFAEEDHGGGAAMPARRMARRTSASASKRLCSVSKWSSAKPSAFSAEKLKNRLAHFWRRTTHMLLIYAVSSAWLNLPCSSNKHRQLLLMIPD